MQSTVLQSLSMFGIRALGTYIETLGDTAVSQHSSGLCVSKLFYAVLYSNAHPTSTWKRCVVDARWELERPIDMGAGWEHGDNC